MEEFPLFMTITVGGYKSRRDLYQEVIAKGHQISDNAMSFIRNRGFTLLKVPTKLDLYADTVKRVTDKDEATTQDILLAIDRLGYTMCPDETAPQLRMQYLNQPVEEWLMVISKQIAFSCFRRGILSIGRYRDRLFVNCRSASPGVIWSGSSRLVFCKQSSLIL